MGNDEASERAKEWNETKFIIVIIFLEKYFSFAVHY